MATPFDDLTAQLNGAVNGLRGEAFTLLPLARPDVNAPAVADTTREKVSFTGTFDDEGARAGSGVQGFEVGSLRKGHPGHTSDRPTISVARTVFAVRPRDRDAVRREATGETFVIGEVIPHGSLFIFQLNR
ncbi:hypothetical protein V5F32_00820 [Xanthobacter oligotrophicus]|uniref:Uncharacterized protein n=1 Tax=Xanthobacter oligotrophicus TaxID=2607286 RepID=A0ABW6ZPP6_9HYPH